MEATLVRILLLKLQVIPETAPEGPEGISVTGGI